MRYREWKLINESLAGVGSMALGLSNPNSLGGPVGSTLREMDDDLIDDEDEMEDDDDLEGDEEEETDLFGDDEFGGDMDFPPDDSEEMDGLPTPDEEMLDGEEDEDDFLGDIDPELAGLDDDEMGMGDEMLGDEEMGDEDALFGDGDFDDAEVEGELGDVEVGDDEEIDPEGDFMDRMADYCGRYMADYMRDHMRSKSRKFMHKDDGGKKKKGRKYMCGKGCDDGIHSREDMTNMADNHFGKLKKESVGTYEESEEDFFATLRGAAKGDHNVQGWSGLSEDMLVQLNNDPNTNFATDEPQPGQAGFAPQGRVGSMGGGYTQDDIQDIPTMPW